MGKLTNNNRRGLKGLSGRIKSLSDSTITIKKMLSKKTLTLNFDNIYQIKKEPVSKFIAIEAVGACAMGVSMFMFDRGPLFGAFISTPAMLPLNLLYPFKRIHDYDIVIE
ncbi:MAG: hypothetical protein M3512_02530 [Bacteroidota bacterium]|nr:hypothetical protein [Bacteroidota bacterium]